MANPFAKFGLGDGASSHTQSTPPTWPSLTGTQSSSSSSSSSSEQLTALTRSITSAVVGGLAGPVQNLKRQLSAHIDAEVKRIRTSLGALADEVNSLMKKRRRGEKKKKKEEGKGANLLQSGSV